jgi:AraC-type DNA-binding domain-containing proteins
MKKYASCKQAISDCLDNKYFSIAHLYNEEKTMDMHIHDCYELFYSLSGGKQFLIDNKFYDIEPGDIFVINQYESHYLTRLEQVVLERIVIPIHPEYLKMLSTDKTILDYCFSHRPNNFSHRISLTKEQQQRFLYFVNKITSADHYGSDIIECSAFMELMILVNSICYNNSQCIETSSTCKYDQQVEQILAYINKNIHNEITIALLASHFYLSESYICRIFKSITGTTINKYITARRITIAKALLAAGNNVNSVCEQCGFNDYSNFLKAFTKAVGISPKKYAQISIS